MIYDSFKNFNEDVINFIEGLYKKGESLDTISNITGLNKNILFTILDNERINVPTPEIIDFSLEGNKLLVIADTHFGSKYQNLKYLDEAYNMGVKEGVCGALHLGDIFQGTYRDNDQPVKSQLKTIRDIYPTPNEFETYLVLGNHDRQVLMENPDYMKVLDEKKKLNVTGFKKVYFDWNNYLFSMEHKIKQMKIYIPEVPTMLTFVGHGHELKIKNNSRIKIPTLSDDIINQTNGAFPGFVIANKNDNLLNIEVYNFKDNKAKLKTKSFYKRKYIDEFKVR